MKQITKTPELIARLKRAIGSDQSLDNLSVYEAIALNNRPLRKRHPLYKDAVAQRSMLLEMAARLDGESVPLQVMHDGSMLPIGRVFYGEVVDRAGETELRTLFWVDRTHAATVAAVDNGTIDQVSVGVLPRKMICSADGFDFLGPEAGLDAIYTGRTPKGNQLGQNGVFAEMHGLDQWFEMSLVGMGGAQNARIVNQDQSHFGANLQRLAASGASLDHLALQATAETEQPTMDMTPYLAQLTAATTEAATLKATNVTLEASVSTLTTELTALKAKNAELEAGAPALTAAQAQVTELTAAKTAVEGKFTAADTALRDVLKKVLVASGQVDPKLPDTIEEVVAQITEKSTALVAALGNGGKGAGAEDGTGTKSTPHGTSAYRAR